jgi:hypothetical protein
MATAKDELAALGTFTTIDEFDTTVLFSTPTLAQLNKYDVYSWRLGDSADLPTANQRCSRGASLPVPARLARPTEVGDRWGPDWALRDSLRRWPAEGVADRLWQGCSRLLEMERGEPTRRSGESDRGLATTPMPQPTAGSSACSRPRGGTRGPMCRSNPLTLSQISLTANPSSSPSRRSRERQFYPIAKNPLSIRFSSAWKRAPARISTALNHATGKGVSVGI